MNASTQLVDHWVNWGNVSLEMLPLGPLIFTKGQLVGQFIFWYLLEKGILIEISFGEPRIGTWTMASMKQIPGTTNKFGQVLRIYGKNQPSSITLYGENQPSSITLSFGICWWDVLIFHTQDTTDVKVRPSLSQASRCRSWRWGVNAGPLPSSSYRQIPWVWLSHHVTCLKAEGKAQAPLGSVSLLEICYQSLGAQKWN